MLAAGLIFTETGCRRKPAKSPAARAESALSKDELASLTRPARLKEAVEAKATQYTWMNLNATATAGADGESFPQANVRLKLQKDQLTWAQVNLFIELARMLITNDSATVRISPQKSYLVMSAAEMQQMMGVPGLGMAQLQRLLTGEPPFGIRPEAKIEVAEDKIVVTTTDATGKEIMWLDARHMHLQYYKYEKNSRENVIINYSGWKEKGGRWMYDRMQAEANAKQEARLDLKISDVSYPETDEINFKIPAGYTRMR